MSGSGSTFGRSDSVGITDGDHLSMTGFLAIAGQWPDQLWVVPLAAVEWFDITVRGSAPGSPHELVVKLRDDVHADMLWLYGPAPLADCVERLRELLRQAGAGLAFIEPEPEPGA